MNKKVIASGCVPKKQLENASVKNFIDQVDRNLLPLKTDGCKGVVKTQDNFDKAFVLPTLFYGLIVKQHPQNIYTDKGIDLLLQDMSADELIHVLPQLITPMKYALSCKDTEIIVLTIKKWMRMIEGRPQVCQAFVPQQRQLLVDFVQQLPRNLNLGDKIEQSQRKMHNLPDLISSLLVELEKNGGEDSFINIKYMIPTQESACQM